MWRKGGCHQHTADEICLCKSRLRRELLCHDSEPPWRKLTFMYIWIWVVYSCLQRKHILWFGVIFGQLIHTHTHTLAVMLFIQQDWKFSVSPPHIVTDCQYCLSVPMEKWIFLTLFVSLTRGNPDVHSASSQATDSCQQYMQTQSATIMLPFNEHLFVRAGLIVWPLCYLLWGCCGSKSRLV